jgi:hypothetical protein
MTTRWILGTRREWANGGAQLVARSLEEELPVSNNWVAEKLHKFRNQQDGEPSGVFDDLKHSNSSYMLGY